MFKLWSNKMKLNLSGSFSWLKAMKRFSCKCLNGVCHKIFYLNYFMVRTYPWSLDKQVKIFSNLVSIRWFSTLHLSLFSTWNPHSPLHLFHAVFPLVTSIFASLPSFSVPGQCVSQVARVHLLRALNLSAPRVHHGLHKLQLTYI